MPTLVGIQRMATANEPAPVSAPCPDRGTFADLFRENVGVVYGFCYRRLGSKEAAEDATAQVFVKALAAFPRFRGGSTRGWLFAIANRVVIDEYRRALPHLPLDLIDDRADPAPGPDDEAEHAEMLRTLRDLMGALPNEQRIVLELRLAGLTGVQIAEVIGRSHGTVRNLQHETIATLRRMLGRSTPGADLDA